MSNRITIKQNDLLPVLVATIINEDSTVVDLTNAVSVNFYLRNQYSGVIKVNGTAGSFLAPRTAGQVQYTWIPGDTNTIGDYVAEFVITWPGSEQQTAPQKVNLFISIIDGVK
jgi:hypothetical protein